MNKFSNPQKFSRDQISRPPSTQLLEVSVNTHEEVCNLARNVRKSLTLESSPHFRNFIALALEALGKKLLVIKRIGTNYIPEVGSIQRDLTELVVDFFWVASYYREDPKIAEQLSEQFFLSKKKAYLAQYQFAKSIMKSDVFLKEFFDKGELARQKKEAHEILSLKTVPKEWRRIPDVISNKKSQWADRCERAVQLVREIANLKYAPYLNNLKRLSAYTHWDSQQIQEFSDTFRQALFDRYLNIAIGFVHDSINGACYFSGLNIPVNVRELRKQFVYMST